MIEQVVQSWPGAIWLSSCGHVDSDVTQTTKAVSLSVVQWKVVKRNLVWCHIKCQMSNEKWIYIAQFHAKHLNCARCTSISPTRSSSMCAERHRRSQPVDAVRQAVYSRRSDPRQRRPADRVCYVDTAERSSGTGWLIVDVDWQRRWRECSSWPWCFVLQTPTDRYQVGLSKSRSD